MVNDNFLDRLKHLAKMLPALKKQYGERMMKARAKRNGHLPVAAIPCAICGKKYGQQFPIKTEKKIVEPKHKPYCPACQTKLNDGWCCIVNVAGTRFQWFFGKDMPERFGGQVVPVSDAEFHAIEKHYQKAEHGQP